MPYPLHAPRVNNNDDIVQVVELSVNEGDFVKSGDLVAAVETDKAIVEVEAERDGYVLKILPELDQKVAVGSVMIWLGDSPDEAVPEESTPAVQSASAAAARPTAKARVMLKKLGLDESQVPTSGERLTVTDIEAYLAEQGASTPTAPPPMPVQTREQTPDVPGEYQELSEEAHGMLVTVQWHRDQVAAGYLEVEYDPTPWEEYAAEYARRNKLMLSPLLPLLAYRLVELTKESPNINATVVNDRHYLYTPINLGFTVQADKTLYLTVVRDAQSMSATEYIEALGEVQRHAIAHKLRPSEVTGATITFSSMARWRVSRHIPILPPYTGLMVAHAAPRGSGRAVLGASYDHRLLTGFDVAQVLQSLSQPPVDV
jgi:pyruvate/2-oxoglutarate dehydrogenase complex dihydrolipoamide acyltransferase (E2) component